MNESKFHVALYVDDIDTAVAAYRDILGAEPAKVRHDYAKFELEDPPVILSLNVGGEPGKLSHLGIRFGSTGEVASGAAIAKARGLDVLEQHNARCCYAAGEKYWVRDKSGVAWEMYTLLEDIEADTAADPELRAMLGQ